MTPRYGQDPSHVEGLLRVSETIEADAEAADDKKPKPMHAYSGDGDTCSKCGMSKADGNHF